MSKIKEVPNPTLECRGCIFKDELQCLVMPCLADKDNPIKYIEVPDAPSHVAVEGIKRSDMIKKYRKKPVTIEAIQWNGENLSEIDKFTQGKVKNHESVLIIPTLEGDMYASLNDYIIKGVNGEFYPCKPDIFAKTYEKVTE